MSPKDHPWSHKNKARTLFKESKKRKNRRSMSELIREDLSSIRKGTLLHLAVA